MARDMCLKRKIKTLTFQGHSGIAGKQVRYGEQAVRILDETFLHCMTLCIYAQGVGPRKYG